MIKKIWNTCINIFTLLLIIGSILVSLYLIRLVAGMQKDITEIKEHTKAFSSTVEAYQSNMAPLGMTP